MQIRSGRWIAGPFVILLGWGCYESIAPVAVVDPGKLDSGLPITNPDADDACLPRRPWEGPGVTAVVPTGGANVLILSGDRYFTAELDVTSADASDTSLGTVTAWHDTGLLSNLWAGAPQAIGLSPWDSPGVTAAYVDIASGDQIIISRFRRWIHHGTKWPAAGNIVDDWILSDAGPPLFDGQAPWQGPGVTAAYYTPRGDRFYAVSQDKGWVRDTTDPDPKNWTWIADGGFLLSDSQDWSSAPSISGQKPFEGPGVTAAFYVGPKLFVVSVDRMWAWDGASWTALGPLKSFDGWSSAPAAGCTN